MFCFCCSLVGWLVGLGLCGFGLILSLCFVAVVFRRVFLKIRRPRKFGQHVSFRWTKESFDYNLAITRAEPGN